MENCQMNRPGCRPYNNTCGMGRAQCHSQMPIADRTPCQSDRTPCRYERQQNDNCSCRMPGTVSPEAEMYAHVDHMPVAMAYVPCQEFTTTFDLCYALNVGTIFPQLCKPFCGRRGGCR
ncbi:MAG: spore coat associated protein CotJA [Eubacteriales bacterium]|nr:spore coat associated protein CotJA [Eubacteriales bacterium]